MAGHAAPVSRRTSWRRSPPRPRWRRSAAAVGVAVAASGAAPAGGARRPSASRWTGRPTPTTPACTWRSSRAGSPTRGWTCRSCRTTRRRPTRSCPPAPPSSASASRTRSRSSKAAGADITSVLAVLQHWGTAIGVRADRADIRSPRDLDGKTYGGLRRGLRGAEDAGDHPRGGRQGRLQDGRARHVGVRGALRRAGRLHRAVPGLGGHRGAAAGRAAEDVRLRRLRLPRRLQRDRHRQHAVAAPPTPTPRRRSWPRCSGATSSARTTRRRP